MIIIRPQAQRGVADFGWLDSRHSFSFGNYYDPNHMGFGRIRVINEDRVVPAKGFGTHGHQDMEIISYVLSGELEHWDSLGNGSILRPGMVQRMSAGTGVSHSEFNASKLNSVHFLQIWIEPEQEGLVPSYEEKSFAPRQQRLVLLGSRDGRNDSVTIHQDISLYLGSLDSGDRLSYEIENNRGVWLQMIAGELELNGKLIQAGDGAAITQEAELIMVGTSPGSEFLLFELGVSV